MSLLVLSVTKLGSGVRKIKEQAKRTSKMVAATISSSVAVVLAYVVNGVLKWDVPEEVLLAFIALVTAAVTYWAPANSNPEKSDK